MYILFKLKFIWGKEVDLLFFLGISYAEELFYVKDNCINEIFMCFYYMKILFYN